MFTVMSWMRGSTSKCEPSRRSTASASRASIASQNASRDPARNSGSDSSRAVIESSVAPGSIRCATPVMTPTNRSNSPHPHAYASRASTVIPRNCPAFRSYVSRPTASRSRLDGT